MIKTTVLAAAMLGFTAMPVLAEYTVKGYISCANAIAEDAHESYREYNKWWLLGYFSARNYETKSLKGNGVPDEDVYQVALNYCKSNPAGDWDDAAIYTYKQF